MEDSPLTIEQEIEAMIIKTVDDFWIPCPHEQATCSTDDVLPDYHALTAAEVTALYEFARSSQDIFAYSRASIRLSQGIEGMVCPCPASGDVFDIHVWLDDFMTNAAEGGRPAPLQVLIRVLAVDA